LPMRRLRRAPKSWPAVCVPCIWPERSPARRSQLSQNRQTDRGISKQARIATGAPDRSIPAKNRKGLLHGVQKPFLIIGDRSIHQQNGRLQARQKLRALQGSDRQLAQVALQRLHASQLRSLFHWCLCHFRFLLRNFLAAWVTSIGNASAVPNGELARFEPLKRSSIST
jgi:hypothetical protein